ncbi:AMP-dependent synthetase/ligase [Chitinophagaceae bacterium LWZ2-11]
MEIKRLFDVLDYLSSKCDKPDLLAAKENGQWRKYSVKEIKDIVNRFSAGLLKLGVSGNDFTIEGSDKIAIISSNRPEWVFTDLAVQQTGAILVPIYPTTGHVDLEFIFNESQVKYAFVSNQEMLDKINSIKDKLPYLKQVFSFDKTTTEHWSSVSALSDDSLLQQVTEIKKSIPVSHLATIIYTSGTTGTPKGVMLSHSNIYSNIMLSKESFPFEDQPEARSLSFLPLNHIFEKTVTYIYLYSCISIYYAESLELIGENLKEVKPNAFTTVPRLLEKVFERIMTTGNELKGVKRKLFFWAIGLGEKYDNLINQGWWYNFQLSIANKLVFKKFREALGNNIQYIITGGAACQVKLLRIFNAAGIPVYEGYGPTEHSPVICVNRKEKGGTKFGTVGPPINGIEVKLAEDGELLVRSLCTMVGYYKRPDLTAETVVDGWLHTGDIAVWDDAKYIKITDRKKELFKTSGGKYVAPQAIENKFKESLFIEQLMAIGDQRKFVSALIVPSFNTLKNWMAEKGINYTTNEDAIQNPKVIELYQHIIDEYNELFNHVEQIKRFALLSKEWSVETGEMTPKLSVKRKVVLEKYKDKVDKIYE